MSEGVATRQKRSLSVRWLLIISFAVPVLLLLLVSGQTVYRVVDAERRASHIKTLTQLVERTRELDHAFSDDLFLGLHIIHDPAPSEEVLTRFRQQNEENQRYAQSLVAEANRVMEYDLHAVHRLEPALEQVALLRTRIVTRQPIQPESWTAAISDLMSRMENLRFLLSSPRSIDEFIMYQQLLVRNAAERLYNYTLTEATALDAIISGDADAGALEHIVKVRELADRQRAILKLAGEYFEAIGNDPYLSPTLRRMLQGTDVMPKLRGAIEESGKAFDVFDDVRRLIYAGTLLGESAITREAWQEELGKVLTYLDNVEQHAAFPLLTAVDIYHQESQSEFRLVLLVGLCLFLLVGLLFFMIYNRVLRPIHMITSGMRRLADGDIKAELPPVRRNDEIGKMLWALLIFKNNALELRETKDRIELILQSAQEGICGMDMEGNTTFVNQAALEMTGYSAEEVLGSGQGNLIQHSYPGGTLFVKEESRIHDACIHGVEHQVEDELFWRRDGSSFPAEYTTSPMRDEDGNLTGTMIVFRDITERKRAEEEIRRHRDHLQDMVDEQTRDLIIAKEEAIVAKEEAERANQLKTEFLANMSHELRTPLHAITNFSKMGIKRMEKWDKDRQVENLTDIKNSGERLSKLVNNLLDISKLEAGAVQYSMKPHNIVTIIEAVIKELSPLIDTKSLTLDHPNSEESVVEVECDKDKMHQVIVNLLANAIKFTPENKSITVTCRQEEEGIALMVRDEGVGIPEDELQTIFDKFIQSAKTNTGAGGTGLGLAISREIVLGHHGKIWAENNTEEGATFHVFLPLVQPPKPEDGKSQPAEPAEK